MADPECPAKTLIFLPYNVILGFCTRIGKKAGYNDNGSRRRINNFPDYSIHKGCLMQYIYSPSTRSVGGGEEEEEPDSERLGSGRGLYKPRAL